MLRLHARAMAVKILFFTILMDGYPRLSALALWLPANLLKKQRLPCTH